MPISLIYTLSLHDALPILKIPDLTGSQGSRKYPRRFTLDGNDIASRTGPSWVFAFRSKSRSEEHTSELQSRGHLVCRLLLEKKNTFRTVSANYQNTLLKSH